MDGEQQFEVPIGRDVRGAPLHWKAPGCRFVTARCAGEAFARLGGYMYGVAIAAIEEIALLKVEAGLTAPDGSVTVDEPDLALLKK